MEYCPLGQPHLQAGQADLGMASTAHRCPQNILQRHWTMLGDDDAGTVPSQHQGVGRFPYKSLVELWIVRQID